MITEAESEFGWLAVAASESTVQGVTIGHASPGGARTALADSLNGEPVAITEGLTETAAADEVCRRLVAYLSGEPDDLRDLVLDLSGLTSFQARVARQCRRVRYGETVSYAELARRSGNHNQVVSEALGINPSLVVAAAKRSSTISSEFKRSIRRCGTSTAATRGISFSRRIKIRGIIAGVPSSHEGSVRAR